MLPLLRSSLTRPQCHSLARPRACVLSPHRFQSSHTTSLRRGLGSHIAAGVAGGAIVIAGAYTWYHFSNVKKVVEASKKAGLYLNQTKQGFKKTVNSNAALLYLRNVAKSYVAIVPGAGSFVDKAFDSVDEIVDAHAEEANIITNSAYAEIQAIIQQSGDKENMETALKVMDVLRWRMGELRALGMKAGGNALSPVLEKFPGAQEKIRGSFKELQSLAKNKGPLAKKAVDDTLEQVKNLFSKNPSPDAPEKAHSLITAKTAELRKHYSASSEDGGKRGES